MGGALVQAAGGVVWRINDGTTEVAVVHRPRYDDWSLPKGKAVRGEHPLDTARREVREETGVHAVLGPRLPTQRYRSPDGPKVVRFWAMSGRDGGFTPSAEVDEARWLPVPEARTVLTHQRDVAVLDALAKAVTVDAAVLLVRHADAATRRGRGAPALDGPGRRRARALRRLLPGFGPGRLVCVPGDGRRDTLTPVATRVRVPVTYEPDVLGVRHGRRLEGNPQRIRDIAAEGGVTVVAAPGSVIREVLTALALPRPRARKGSVWALFFHRARLTGADYYPSLVEPRH